MCILFIAIDQHPDHSWVIAANRDEFHRRPTQTVHFWPQQNIYAGKDLEAGGTWLGVNQQGDFAALTNIRDLRPKTNDKQHSQPAALELKSRGELVTLALAENSPINLSWLNANAELYNPFNLIYSRNKQLYCYNSQQKKQQLLALGFHAVCNGALDDKWPKMAQGEQELEHLVSRQAAINVDDLLTIMQNNSQAPDELLPDTGIGLQWEKFLSSIFIVGEQYGTRSTSVVLSNVNQTIDLYEQSYQIDGNVMNKQQIKIQTKEIS